LANLKGILTGVGNPEPISIPQELDISVSPGFVVRTQGIRDGQDGA